MALIPFIHSYNSYYNVVMLIFHMAPLFCVLVIFPHTYHLSFFPSIKSAIWQCYFHYAIFYSIPFLKYCSSLYHLCGHAVSTTVFFYFICAGILKHRSLIHQSSGDAVLAAVFHFLCACIPHMIYLFYQTWFWYLISYFIYLIFSYVLALMPHTLLLIF